MSEPVKRKSLLTLTNIILVIVLALSIAAIVLASENKEYSESLFSSNLNTATFKQSPSLELLYSYPINSGNGTNSGYFTVTVDGPFQIPNISFGVQDQLGRSIINGKPVPNKITRVNFTGIGDPSSTVANLYIFPKSGNIILKNLTVNLYK